MITDFTFLIQSCTHLLILHLILHGIQGKTFTLPVVLMMEKITLMKKGMFFRDNISSYPLREFNMKGLHILLLKVFLKLEDFFLYYKLLLASLVENLPKCMSFITSLKSFILKIRKNLIQCQNHKRNLVLLNLNVKH